ncbi:uncharacterized protein BDZ99DRAFT_461383 [Mytilinidion resinicola]|uniref:Uncharacterized protein n=1 Tax=Mytilinidion resinicola TaxID=574789 RepID=A0A6A6YXM2_9PEZI|nr:uncharacterized protein BDZ99DRAFT_461383 [Mytilinidion resinicola]KAF2812744.1 hypothetical protein BDZ99DRAFT_461383 [Mytilinidion resinicola]
MYWAYVYGLPLLSIALRSLKLTKCSVNSNPWKLASWVLARILHDARLREKIEAEIAPYFTSTNSLSPVKLALKLRNCSYLMATYSEVLWTTSSSTSVRKVDKDCVIGGKTL